MFFRLIKRDVHRIISIALYLLGIRIILSHGRIWRIKAADRKTWTLKIMFPRTRISTINFGWRVKLPSYDNGTRFVGRKGNIALISFYRGANGPLPADSHWKVWYVGHRSENPKRYETVGHIGARWYELSTDAPELYNQTPRPWLTRDNIYEISVSELRDRGYRQRNLEHIRS